MEEKETVPTSELFERIGILVVRVDDWKRKCVVYQQDWQRTSQVAGQALRALESIGRKDIHDAILAGKPWDTLEAAEVVAEVPAVAPETTEG